ncbi:MAG: hypothetical protein ACLFOY_10545 [Desulfatibacillaceae bacterium]
MPKNSSRFFRASHNTSTVATMQKNPNNTSRPSKASYSGGGRVTGSLAKNAGTARFPA